MSHSDRNAESVDDVELSSGAIMRNDLKRDWHLELSSEPQLPKRNRIVHASENKPLIAREDYTIGWICALPIELAAAVEMMDEEFADIPSNPTDSNIYSFGRIGHHNIVAACLPAGQMGISQAAIVASQMSTSFPSLRFGVLVGVGGGVPNLDENIDIRLGDVVISQPAGQHGGVVLYDFGKTGADGRIARTGSLNAPPTILLTALAKFRANQFRGKTQVAANLSKLSCQPNFASPGPENDTLYEASSPHIAGATCAKCRPEDIVHRESRLTTDPCIFFGNIACGNQVMKDGPTRDRYSQELGGVLCFEMEAAGLMNNFPCIVIRGVCDYADAHKNKRWQPYAAATAAACAKELLSVVPPIKVLQEKTIQQLVSAADEQLQVSTQQLILSSEHLAEHKRTNQILEDSPIDLLTIDEARYDSADVQNSPKCEKGTRIRIREAITQWTDKDQAEPLFWLVGPAGTGKSTIARTIADTFASKQRLVASYFFKRGEKGRNGTTRLFSTLAIQLAESIPSFKRHLRNSLGGLDKDAVEKRSLEVQFQKLLLQPLKELPADNTCPLPSVVIIDALDECERPDHLLRVLTLLLQLHEIDAIRLRVLLTSRRTPCIIDAFKLVSHEYLDLHEKHRDEANTDITKFLQQRFVDIKAKWGIPEPWPDDAQFRRLISLSTTPSPLFIYAATFCRFIDDPYGIDIPTDQLDIWLQKCYSNASQLDQIYAPILHNALFGSYDISEKPTTLGETHRKELFNVLGTVIFIATPLSAQDIASLLDISLYRVTSRLRNLHAVLSVPQDTQTPVQILHKSFSDFLLGQESPESRDYRIDAAETHAMLAAKCIQRMKAGLKQDLCDVRKPGISRDEIDQQAIDAHIPANLEYACLYWVHHLQHSKRSIHNDVSMFLYKHFLNWLEALVLLGKLLDGALAIRELQKISKRLPDTPLELIEFIKDASQVVSSFWSIIERAPLQIYGALLFFSPVTSKVRQMFWCQRLLNHVDIQGVNSEWGSHIQTLEGHESWVNAVAFSPDGQVVASAARDRTVRLWDTTTGAIRQTLKGHSASIDAVAFSPSHKVLASASRDKTVCLWDTTTGAHRQTLKGHSASVSVVTFSPDSQMVASASYDNTIRLWEVRTGTHLRTLEGHSDWVKAVAFSPSGQLLLSASNDKTIQLWNMVTYAHIKTLKSHGRYANAVAFSPDGQVVASASEIKLVRLWDATTGAYCQTLEGHSDWVEAVVFSPDGNFLASASRDKTVRIWDIAAGVCRQILKGHSKWVTAITFSPDGQVIASASQDQTIRIWYTKTGGYRQTLEGHRDRISAVVLSPNSRIIASVSWDRTVKLWDVPTGTHRQTLKDYLDSIDTVTFSPNSQVLVILERHQTTVRIWDIVKGAYSHTISHRYAIEAIAFSSDSQIVASVSCDITVRLWDVATGACLQTFRSYNGYAYTVAYSPNSQLIALPCGSKVELWEVATGAHHQTLEGHVDWVDIVVFSPNSQVVASASRDKIVRLWEVATGALLQTLEGHSDRVINAAFSPNSQVLASSSEDGTVWFWDTGTGALRQTLDVGSTRHLAFDPLCSARLHTDSATIDLISTSLSGGAPTSDETSEETTSTMALYGLGISLDKTWIMNGNERVIWLPREYRPTASAVRNSVVVIGCRSGRLIRIMVTEQ